MQKSIRFRWIKSVIWILLSVFLGYLASNNLSIQAQSLGNCQILIDVLGEDFMNTRTLINLFDIATDDITEGFLDDERFERSDSFAFSWRNDYLYFFERSAASVVLGRYHFLSGDVDSVFIEHEQREFVNMDRELPGERYMLLDFITPARVEGIREKITAHYLIDWQTQTTQLFPYQINQIGLNVDGEISFMGEFEDDFRHDNDIVYQPYLNFSVETGIFTFNDVAHDGIPFDTFNSTRTRPGWDWSDNYGLIWYQYSGDERGVYAWQLGAEQAFNPNLLTSRHWGNIQISPDGTRLLRESLDHIWVYELDTQVVIYEVTTDEFDDNTNAIWLGNNYILYTSDMIAETIFHIVSLHTGADYTFTADEPLIFAVKAPLSFNYEESGCFEGMP